MITKTLRFIKRHEFNFFIIALIGLSFALRLAFHKARSGDMVGCYLVWFEGIEKNGGISSLRENIYVYPPLYIYHLILASKIYAFLPRIFVEPQVFAIKLMSFFWDYATAFLIYRIVKLKQTSNTDLPKLAAVVFLFLPTVFLNSALLGQCDIMYAAGIIAATYYFCLNRHVAAALCIGFAFSFKLQTVFIAPALLIFIILKRMPWQSLLLIPFVYLVSVLPAWAAGRPLYDLLMVYPVQTILGNELTYHAANIYQWLPTNQFYMYERAGKVLGTSAALGFVALFVRKRPNLRPADIIQVVLFCFVLLPFLLPKMHERYFFVADILAMVFAFFRPQFFRVAIAQSFVSFLAYSEAIQMTNTFIPMAFVALIQGWILVELAKDFINLKDHL